MEKLIWNESFSVGVPLLDAQHMELFRMINKLIEAEDLEVNSETISEILSDMTNYAILHFKTEEDYMNDGNYPDFLEHKKEHSEFRKKTLGFCMDTMDNKDTVPAEIFTF